MSLAAIIDSWEEKVATLEDTIRLQNIDHGLDLLEMQLEIERYKFWVETYTRRVWHNNLSGRSGMIGMTWD
jgi:hypothetical protein